MELLPQILGLEADFRVVGHAVVLDGGQSSQRAQVGGGRGKDLATIAGAAGGAYAGREVEKRVNTHKVWVVRVTFPNNEAATYEFAQDPGLKAGDGVRKSDKTVVKI